MTAPVQCPLCRAPLATRADRAAHACQLGEQFFQDAVARWQEAGVRVVISPTDYDGHDRAGKEQR